MTAAFQLRQIAVIGAGMAGRTFALRCAAAGFAVVLEDVMPEKLRRAQDEYAALPGMSSGTALRFADTVEDAVRDADMAVDFVPDELESKLEIFCMLDRMAPPRTVLLTPIETLSLDDLASCTYRPGLCAGVRHGLSGASATLVRGRLTHVETVTAVQHTLRRIGMDVSVVQDKVETSLTGRAVKPDLAGRRADREA